MAKPVGRRGETRERVLAAALELFAEHGVSGTSLQMIADRLGVTKAAVYHQFRTKDDIVREVLGPALESLEALIGSAEAHAPSEDRRRLVVHGLIDIVLGHRRLLAIFYGDPSADAVLKGHAAAADRNERLGLLLAGPDPDPAANVGVAVFGGGLVMAGADPNLAALDDDTLRRELRAAAERLLFA